jgi:hypothetical protein
VKVVRTVSLQVVLGVAPDDRDTRRAIEECGGARWWELEFDRADVGQIHGQSVHFPHPLEPVADLYQERVVWMASPGGSKSLRKHQDLVKDLAGPGIRNPPILVSSTEIGWDRQILDGAHRTFAAYEFMDTHPAYRLLVYWNRPG